MAIMEYMHTLGHSQCRPCCRPHEQQVCIYYIRTTKWAYRAKAHVPLGNGLAGYNTSHALQRNPHAFRLVTVVPFIWARAPLWSSCRERAREPAAAICTD